MNIERHFFENIRQVFLSIVGFLESGLVVLDKNNNVDVINSAALELLNASGQSLEECVDQKFSSISVISKNISDKIDQLLVTNKKRQFCEQIKSSNERVIRIRAIKKLSWVIVVIDDLTSTKGLLYEATHDYLTQLYNRRFFESRLSVLLEDSDQYKSSDVVAFIDLNGFKIINDLAGYICGDEVLKMVSISIMSYIGPSDVAFRVGGDEFAIIFKNTSLENAKSSIGLMRKRVNELVVHHRGDRIRVDFSAGLTNLDADNFKNVGDLVSYLMAVCRVAKSSEAGKILAVKSREIDKSILISDSGISNSIANALLDNNFVLFGQKIESKTIKSSQDVEILLRLKSASGKYIPPAVFLPVAERFSMMGDVDQWVIIHSFKNLKKGFRFFINISGNSLCELDFPKFVEREAVRYGVDTKEIVFEITETQALSNLESARANIVHLQKLGFKIALDDFGSGFSSLLYLKSLPVDILKIDGQIVKEMHYDNISYNMVKMICSMAKEMSLEIVVEFVHCEELYELLIKFDVDFLQGFYLHEPMELIDVINI
ncbi:MAG: bifunctional diguanylate cyclase/phosphodiesterase [Planctomycetes bacterium]|nr:bifunctional diguanylate cyclase/phosphodiesterase [Planctomycetota bacterium]